MLVIFDCDGVLINSEDLIEEAQQEAYAEFGVDFTLDDIRTLFTGLAYEDYNRRHDEEFVKHTGHGAPATFDARLHDIFNEKARTQLAAIEGIPELLAALEDADVTFCVASNSGIPGLHLKLTLTGLHDKFEPRIYSREHVALGKPAPDLFWHAAREAGGFDPADCVVVEDSRPGVVAGVAAGMRVIGLARHGSAQADSLRSGGAHDIASNANELKQKIFQLLNRPIPPPRPGIEP